MTLEKIKARFSELVPGINHAAEVLGSEAAPPREVSEMMHDLVASLEQGREWIQHSLDEGAIRRCIDELQEKSERARRACEQSAAVSRRLKDAVSTADWQISELKEQLH